MEADGRAWKENGLAVMSEKVSVKLDLDSNEFERELARLKGEVGSFRMAIEARRILFGIVDTACVVAIWELLKLIF